MAGPLDEPKGGSNGDLKVSAALSSGSDGLLGHPSKEDGLLHNRQVEEADELTPTEAGSSDNVEHSSRRGHSSLRNRTLDAFATTCFPTFPDGPAQKETDFELPRGLIDNDAPLSVRKWDLALSLATMATEVATKRREVLAAGMAAASAAKGLEEGSKRQRKPSSVMYQNIEMARMMGAPGSKQRHLTHEDLGWEDKPAPQHLCSNRPKQPVSAPAPATSTCRAATGRITINPATGGARTGSGGCKLAGSNEEEGFSSRKRPDSSVPRTIGANGEPGSSNAHDGWSGGRPLPILVTIPSTGCEVPSGVAKAVVHSLMRPGVPLSVGQIARSVAGTQLPSELSGKRRRRPPGWLLEHDQGDEEGTADEETPTSEGQRRAAKKRSLAPSAVSATLVDDRSEQWAGPEVANCTVTIYGVLPSPAARSRHTSMRDQAIMPPPVSTHSSNERSPKRASLLDVPDPGHRAAHARGISPKVTPTHAYTQIHLTHPPAHTLTHDPTTDV